jgi:hypothetical protein
MPVAERLGRRVGRWIWAFRRALPRLVIVAVMTLLLRALAFPAAPLWTLWPAFIIVDMLAWSSARRFRARRWPASEHER